MVKNEGQGREGFEFTFNTLFHGIAFLTVIFFILQLHKKNSYM